MNLRSHQRNRLKVMFNIFAICALTMTWFLTFSLTHHEGGAKISKVHNSVAHNPTEGMEDIVDGDAKLESRKSKSAQEERV